MATPPGLDQLSYRALRRLIGGVAAALPFVLLVGKQVRDRVGPEPRGLPGFPGSISDYYYTSMRNVFVGTMCALAVFLFAYRYARDDRRWSNVAAVAALGVALFPTVQPGSDPRALERVVQGVHLGSAATFFAVLAYFSLRIFTRTDPTRQPTPAKLRRNAVYRRCGWAIVVLGLLAVGNGVWEGLDGDYPLNDLNALFWLETAMVEAFAVSWIIKGETLLADPRQA